MPSERQPDKDENRDAGSSREQILTVIRTAGTPVGVAEIASRIGIHRNTVRFHLDSLLAEGVIERAATRHTGPGRPGSTFRARPGTARGGDRRYRMLAEVLLSSLVATDTDTTGAVTAAGRVWGGRLVDRPPPFHRLTAKQAAARLVTMLDDLGFAPAAEPDQQGVPERVALRHCPFLELAQQHRDLVCPLHLGLMQGALDELDAPLAATALLPFAAPDASCIAELSVPGDGRPGLMDVQN